MTGIQIAAFDAYGTLFDVHSASERLRPELGEHADRLSEIWRTKQLQYTWLRGLMQRYVDFWVVTEEALDYAMRAVGLESPGLRTKLLEAYRQIEPYPEVREVLTTLRARGIKTAILSNGAPRMLEDAVRHAGLEDALDAVLSVDVLRVFKPDPFVYRLPGIKFGVSDEAVSFQTANAWDAAGASTAGLKVIWVNRFKQPQEVLPGSIEHIIDNLSELPMHLPGEA